MKKTERGSFAGFLVLDDTGKICCAAGLGSDGRIVSLVKEPRWRSDAIARRMVGVEIDQRKLVIVWAQAVDHHFAVIIDGITDAVFEFTSTVDFAWDIVHHLITDPFNAMTVVDADGRVAFIASVHEDFFGIEHCGAIGKPVRDIIENTRLDHVVRTGRAEIGYVQRMRGKDRIVNRTPIFRDDEVVGAIGRVMFKGPEQVDALNRRVNALEKELQFYQREARALRRTQFGLDEIVGESDAIRRLKDDIVRVAPLDIPVLILGESGTGKELVAFSIHRLSERRQAEMVVVNAAAMPASLVESELFGYEAGAFTGADRKGRRGKFEQASKSSLFLDEVGDMPLEVQAKLLRVLQDRIVRRIGGETSRALDFRLIAATNRDLRSLVADEQFRLDFYYRISPIVLKVPSLSERPGDIPILVRRFLADFGEKHQLAVPKIADEVFPFLMGQAWPGNVRELRHEIERAVIFGDGDTLRISDFRRSDLGSPIRRPEPVVVEPPSVNAETLERTLARVEEEAIRESLVRNKGNKKRAAEELGISRSYLYKKLGGDLAGC